MTKFIGEPEINRVPGEKRISLVFYNVLIVELHFRVASV